MANYLIYIIIVNNSAITNEIIIIIGVFDYRFNKKLRR